MTDHELVGGQRLTKVHNPDQCLGEWCCIHNPSDHHMDEWPQNWRQDRRIMERICPHGIGHPDPDDPKTREYYESIHGCDGCCAAPELQNYTESAAPELHDNPYREYYLASEECLRLCETVGVTKEQWDANQERYSAAIAACEALEATRDIVIEEVLPAQD